MRRYWLTHYREKKGYTLRELAAEIDCSYPYLSDLETGRRKPSGSLAFKLSKILEFDMENFFDEKKAEEENKKSTKK